MLERSTNLFFFTFYPSQRVEPCGCNSLRERSTFVRLSKYPHYSSENKIKIGEKGHATPPYGQ